MPLLPLLAPAHASVSAVLRSSAPARASLYAPRASADPPCSPTRRWNEKLLYGVNAIRTTDWSEVAAQGWSELKGLKERFAPSAEEAVAEVRAAEKQV